MLGYKLTYMSRPALSIEFTAPFACIFFRLCEYAQKIDGNQGKNIFFSPSGEMPVRAEFFGDEIESLRYFEALALPDTAKAALKALTPANYVGNAAEQARDV